MAPYDLVAEFLDFPDCFALKLACPSIRAATAILVRTTQEEYMAYHERRVLHGQDQDIDVIGPAPL